MAPFTSLLQGKLDRGCSTPPPMPPGPKPAPQAPLCRESRAVSHCPKVLHMLWYIQCSPALSSPAAWQLREVTVGQAEGVQSCVAHIVPEQLLLQEGHCVQCEHQRLMLQHAVHIEAWGQREGRLGGCTRPAGSLAESCSKMVIGTAVPPLAGRGSRMSTTSCHIPPQR